MKKIACLTLAPPSNYGGAELVWKNLEKSFDLNFYTIKGDKGNNIHPVPKFFSKLPNLFHFSEIFSAKSLCKNALKENPDIIIYDKMLGWPLKKTKCKKIAYAQGLYLPAGRKFKEENFLAYLVFKYFVAPFEKKSYVNADKIIAVSKSVKSELIEEFGINEDKIIVINNGVDDKKFKSIKDKRKLRRKFGLDEDKVLVLFPTRNSYGKGFDIAREVANKMEDKIDLVVLSGNEGEEEGNIQYLGKVPYESLVEIYNLADIVLFPSRYEGNSLTVLEAASCKTPLVASKVGLLSTEKEMNEYLADNVEDYIKKIDHLMNKKNWNLASKKWKKFSMKYPLKNQIKEFKEVLD